MDRPSGVSARGWAFALRLFPAADSWKPERVDRRRRIAAIEFDAATEELRGCIQGHYECEDCFYACPKASEYCGLHRGGDCDCGGDARLQTLAAYTPEEPDADNQD